MAYYLDLFSPLTYEAFLASSKHVSGFRLNQKNAANRVKPGDFFVCYLTKVSRWVGVLRVLSPMFEDKTPLFVKDVDPFIIRFNVEPLILLDPKFGIPIKDDRIWSKLSITSSLPKEGSQWTGPLRNSLRMLSQKDGDFLYEQLRLQAEKPVPYPLDDEFYQKHLIKSPAIGVSIPEDTKTAEIDAVEEKEIRESVRIQALLCKIGEKMGFKIWLPRSDRNSVIQEWAPENDVILDSLPLNYDTATLKTIEQIDVLWLKRRSIIRAFEIEHTTSIYSGILRMADLLALQPNMDIKLHIVAPEERKEKVFSEIKRPVFSLLEKGALSLYCTYLSYDSIRELSKEKHLSNLSHTVLEDYEEYVD